MPEHLSCRVEVGEGVNLRLDQYIAGELGLFTRSQVRQRIIEVDVNGEKSKLSHRVKTGDRLDIYYVPPPSQDVLPEDLSLNIQNMVA